MNEDRGPSIVRNMRKMNKKWNYAKRKVKDDDKEEKKEQEGKK